MSSFFSDSWFVGPGGPYASFCWSALDGPKKAAANPVYSRKLDR